VVCWAGKTGIQRRWGWDPHEIQKKFDDQI